MTLFLDRELQYRSGIAQYVQTIHTSNNFGTTRQTGDVDIYMDYKFETLMNNFMKKHGLSVFVHMASSTKRIFMLAEEDGQGKIIVNADRKQTQPIPKSNECLIGIYGELDESKQGKSYNMSLTYHSKVFWDNLKGFVNEKYFK